MPASGVSHRFLLPRRPAGQRLASSSEDDIAGDDREHAPHGQEPPPVQFDGEVKRDHPHLDQSHQLRRRMTQLII